MLYTMFENILKNVSKKITLTEEEQKEFTSLLEVKHFPKKTFLLEEGEISDFEGYINKGAVRTYYVKEDGSEITLFFAIEDWWVGDLVSFTNQIPSQLYIETLEDCEIFMLSPETKEELLQNIPKFERFFRLLVQSNLAALKNRLIGMMAKSATERYLEFIKLYPTVPQRVPQYCIATYLGVSPEFVSTIRKRLAKKQS